MTQRRAFIARRFYKRRYMRDIDSDG